MNWYFTPRNVIIGGAGLLAVLGIVLFKHLLVLLVLALVIVVAILGLVLYLYLREMRSAQAGKEIKSSLDRQVEEEIGRSTYGQQVEVRNIKAEWDAALEELRKSPVGRRLGDKALAELPMFLLIGPAAAGKSTLVTESGVQTIHRDQSQKPRSVRGVGGSRSFDWWFTEDAFLLDMTGKTLRDSAFEDTEDWVAFLQSLRRQRPMRPINGVVLTVPLPTVADAGKDELDKLTRLLRERVSDLGTHLKTRFPVYVVFTHADALLGFAETFASFTPEQAAQPWGMTLALARSEKTPAETLFDSEYSVLISALADLRGARVRELPDETQRMRALAFPSQLEQLRPALRAFVQRLFEREKGRPGAGIFRGLYLVSAKVEDASLDRVVAAAARELQLPVAAGVSPPIASRHSWFLQSLWRKIVFRDSMLASADDYAIEAQKRGRAMTLSACGLAFVILTTLFWTVSCSVNEPAHRAAEAARALRDTPADAVLRDELDRLEPVRASLDELESLRTHRTFWMRLGAYSGDRLLDPLREFYVRRALRALVEPVAPNLPTLLSNQAAANTSHFSDLFYTFKAWRLLSDPHAKVEAADSVVMSRVMIGLHEEDLARIANDRKGYEALIRSQFRTLSELGEPRERPLRDDPALTARALAAITQRWGERLQLYDDMVADANAIEPTLTVPSILDRPHSPARLLAGTTTVPGAFTRRGWEACVRPRLNVIAHMLDRVVDPQLGAALGADADAFLGQIATRYSDDYVKAWTTFLEGVRNKDASLLRSNRTMAREATNDGEIERLLRRVREETRPSGERTEIRRIADEFHAIDVWYSQPPDYSWWDRLLAHLRPRKDYEDRVSPDENFRRQMARTATARRLDLDPRVRTALNVAVLRFDPSGPVKGAGRGAVLDLFKNAYTPGWQSYLSGLPGVGGGGGGGGGGAPVEEFDPTAFAVAYGSEIGQKFAAMRSAYPFAPSASAEVPLGDFAAFFGPTGTLKAFYDKWLANYLTTDGTWRGARPPGVSDAQVRFFKKGFEIQNALFDASGLSLTFDVKTNTQLVRGPSLHSITWKVGADAFVYDNGEEVPKTLVWNAATAGPGSSLSADLGGHAADGPQSATPWGLFRVLDAAASLQPRGTDVLATWKFGGASVGLLLVPSKSAHPFHRGFFELSP